MQPLGFSTGCLRKTNLSMLDRLKLYLSAGATAVEIGLITAEELFEFKLTKTLAAELNKFKHITFHCPRTGFKYGNNLISDKVIKELKQLSKQLPIKGFVIHPNHIDSFDYLADSSLPFLIENMDKTQPNWSKPIHFQHLIDNYNFNFCLDLQHVYEADPTMKLTKEFIKTFGKRLTHLHVSGCTKTEPHFPSHAADNREAIAKALKLKIPVPKIIEGWITTDINKTINDEVKFLRSF